MNERQRVRILGPAFANPRAFVQATLLWLMSLFFGIVLGNLLGNGWPAAIVVFVVEFIGGGFIILTWISQEKWREENWRHRRWLRWLS